MRTRRPGWTTQSAQAHLERLHALLALGRSADARTAADRALELDPALTEARAARALAALDLGRPEDALADADAALAAGEAPALLALRAQAYEALGRLPEAITDYERALDQRPDQVAWRRALAADLTAAGDLQRAEQAWRDVILAAPDDLQARRARIVVLMQLGRPADALPDCDAVLTADPDDAGVLFSRGVARRENGDLAGAVADLTRGLDLGIPNPALVLAARARCHRRAGDLVAAAADLDQAIAGGAGTADRLERGLVRLELGNLDGAIADLDAVRTERPQDAEVLVSLARAYDEQGRHAEAKELIDLALELDPGDPELLRIRAAYRLGLDDRSGGLSDLHQALAADPRDVQALGLRAWVRVDLWQLGDASADVKAALALRPEDPDLMFLRARIAQLQGRPLDALLDLDQVAGNLSAGDTRRGYVLAERAAVHINLGNLDDAEADLAAAHPGPDPPANVLYARAMLRRRQTRPAEAVSDLQAVVDGSLDDSDVHHLLALAAWEAGDAELAQQHIQTAIHLAAAAAAGGWDGDRVWLPALQQSLYLVAAGDPSAIQRYHVAIVLAPPADALRNALDDLARLGEHSRYTGRDLPVRAAGALLRAELAQHPVSAG